MAKVDASFIYGACERNDIPHSRIGKSYKFRKAEVLQWLTTKHDGAKNSMDDYEQVFAEKPLERVVH